MSSFSLMYDSKSKQKSFWGLIQLYLGKCDLLEETLMFNSENTAKVDFSHLELRVRILFWF